MSNTSTTPNGTVKTFNENTVDLVLNKVSAFQNQGGLKLPSNYSAENSVRAAWLMLQDIKDINKNLVLTICTKESIANALLDMVLQGLNPIKKQCYFIAYGNKLVCQKSYIGTIAVSKRVANVKEVKAVPIYEGDIFEYSVDLKTGRKEVTKHEQKFDNIDPDKTKGAYAIVTLNDGTLFCEIMNMKQITASWNMGASKGQSPAHKGFRDEMSCKTVINRSLKTAIGSSDDADLFDEPDFPLIDQALANVTHKIEANANKEPIGFDEGVDKETGEILPPNTQVQEPVADAPSNEVNNNSQPIDSSKPPF